MMIRFVIPGEPQGKGRPKFSRQGNFVKTYTPAKTENYEAHIVLYGLRRWHDPARC